MITATDTRCPRCWSYFHPRDTTNSGLCLACTVQVYGHALVPCCYCGRETTIVAASAAARAGDVLCKACKTTKTL